MLYVCVWSFGWFTYKPMFLCLNAIFVFLKPILFAFDKIIIFQNYKFLIVFSAESSTPSLNI